MIELNSIKPKVYIASPFFSPNQLTRVALVETLLEKLGIEYYSPRKVLICAPDEDTEVRKAIFKSNHDAILDCNLMIAITDDKDTGTIWEMGCAYALGVPVIGVAFTLGNNPFNLMLSESCVSTCTTFEKLVATLTTGEMFYHEGPIE